MLRRNTPRPARAVAAWGKGPCGNCGKASATGAEGGLRMLRKALSGLELPRWIVRAAKRAEYAREKGAAGSWRIYHNTPPNTCFGKGHAGPAPPAPSPHKCRGERGRMAVGGTNSGEEAENCASVSIQHA